MTIIVAFDIEHSGTEPRCSIIGLGACAMEDSKIVDTLFIPALHHKTHFEVKCYDEFWSKHLDQLEKLKVQTSFAQEKIQQDLIVDFQKFRTYFEEKAARTGQKYYLVCDNPVFDAGHLNKSIERYTKSKPIPYSASTQTYDTLFDVYSWQIGVLSVLDTKFDRNTQNASERIRQLHKIDPPPVKHDHNCENDAINIAHDFDVLLNIEKFNQHTEIY